MIKEALTSLMEKSIRTANHQNFAGRKFNNKKYLNN